MNIRISTDDGVPIYQQVVRQVRSLVASGKLGAGEQLPSVRKLAEQLLVNPNTVARAYRELEASGTVEARRGAGVFVSDGPSPLSRKERNRIINERIEALLTEAQHLGIDTEDIIRRIEQRSLEKQK